MAIESMTDTAEVHRHCHAMPLAQHAKESCQRVSVGCTYQEGMEEIGGVISRECFSILFPVTGGQAIQVCNDVRPHVGKFEMYTMDLSALGLILIHASGNIPKGKQTHYIIYHIYIYVYEYTVYMYMFEKALDLDFQ